VLDGLLILVKIITSWPVQQRLPALDLLRLVAAASPIAAEYKAGDADLLTVITDSGSVSAQYANNTMLTVRAFVNMFQTDAGKNYVDQKYEEVSFSNISAHLTELTQYKILELVKNAAKDTTNRNLKIAEATLLLKYVPSCIQHCKGHSC
jgi:phospholipase A-2-activating protein